MIRELKTYNGNVGDSNPNAKMTAEDVLKIRERYYINNELSINIYQDYKRKISYSAFNKALYGYT